MEQLTGQVRKTAKEVLEKREANLVIGWEKGSFPYVSTPVFITKPEQAERLVWDEYCVPNLAKYLMEYQDIDGKVAVFVKGCDARGINRLIQDKQIGRDKVLLIGLACPGMKDGKKAQEPDSQADIPLAQKCRDCRYPNPAEADIFLGGNKIIKNIPDKKDYSGVKAIEAMSADEKYKTFAGNYEKCLRCNACRNICPACNCKDCILDHPAKGWLSKANNVSENMFFAMARALHVAGRCIDCGECERVCPVNIPIMLLNHKLTQDINELFGEYEAGLDPEGKIPLGSFEFTDPEEFR